jgi:hypothetical protein
VGTTGSTGVGATGEPPAATSPGVGCGATTGVGSAGGLATGATAGEDPGVGGVGFEVSTGELEVGATAGVPVMGLAGADGAPGPALGPPTPDVTSLGCAGPEQDSAASTRATYKVSL